MAAEPAALAADPELAQAALDQAGAVLRVRDVAKCFRHGVWPLRRCSRVLKGASLDVRAGELVGLVGENGSGKSRRNPLARGVQRDSWTAADPCRARRFRGGPRRCGLGRS